MINVRAACLLFAQNDETPADGVRAKKQRSGKRSGKSDARLCATCCVHGRRRGRESGEAQELDGGGEGIIGSICSCAPSDLSVEVLGD